MSIVWAIRHGQASFGASEYDVLSETGIRQSEITGRYLQKARGCFDSVYTGTMKRQQDTAAHALKLMARGATPVIAAEFDEYDFAAISKTQLPGLMAEDPEVAEQLPDIFKDNVRFQQFFDILLTMKTDRICRTGIAFYEDLHGSPIALGFGKPLLYYFKNGIGHRVLSRIYPQNRRYDSRRNAIVRIPRVF